MSSGYSAMALVDSADIGGIIRFAMEADSVGVKPIAGAEMRVDGFPIALLARIEQGYRNLAHLVTQARLENQRGHAGVSLREVEERSEGLHLLTGPPAGELSCSAEAPNRRRAGSDRSLARSVRRSHGGRGAAASRLRRGGGARPGADRARPRARTCHGSPPTSHAISTIAAAGCTTSRRRCAPDSRWAKPASRDGSCPTGSGG